MFNEHRGSWPCVISTVILASLEILPQFVKVRRIRRLKIPRYVFANVQTCGLTQSVTYGVCTLEVYKTLFGAIRARFGRRTGLLGYNDINRIHMR